MRILGAPTQAKQFVFAQVGQDDLGGHTLNGLGAPERRIGYIWRGLDRRTALRFGSFTAAIRLVHFLVAFLDDARDKFVMDFGVDQPVHAFQALEGVFAVKDTRAVWLTAAFQKQNTSPKAPVDGRSANQHGIFETTLRQLVDNERHLFGGANK